MNCFNLENKGASDARSKWYHREVNTTNTSHHARNKISYWSDNEKSHILKHPISSLLFINIFKRDKKKYNL